MSAVPFPFPHLFLQVAQLRQPEEDGLLDGRGRVVHVHGQPVVPEDGAGEDVQAEVGEVGLALGRGRDRHVVQQVQGALEVGRVGGRVVRAHVQLMRGGRRGQFLLLQLL